MNIDNELLKALTESTELIIKERLRELKFNYCIQARVIKRNMNGTYSVKINEKDEHESIAKEKLGVYYPPSTLVEILVKNSDNNEKYILWKI